MPNETTLAKKQEYFGKLIQLLKEHSKILIVHADHVGSAQMQQIRKALRGTATVLMGKNTMIRKAIRGHVGEMPELEKILPHVKSNIGFVFCKDDIQEVRKVITENRVPAAARAGVFAPCDVSVPAGPTGLDPSQTSFFQALSIATKINKGQIEITNPVGLIQKGDKVGSSEAVLLTKLNIKPFSYGLELVAVYDEGSVYDPEVLDLTDDDLVSKFMNGLNNVAGLSRQIHFLTSAAVPHLILDCFKNLVAVILDTEYSFKQGEQLKEFVKNPEAFASAAPAAGGGAAEEKAEEKAEEDEEESDDDMGAGGLFGDDEDM